MNARSAALGFMAALGLLLPALGQAQPSFAKTLQFWNNKGFIDPVHGDLRGEIRGGTQD